MKRSINQQIQHDMKQITGVDFHRFIEKEVDFSNVELSEEFGISLHNVKSLKKKLSR